MLDERLEESLGFTFKTEDGGFSVARIRTEERARIVAVGPIGHVTEGQHLVMTGRWVSHATHGKQFKVKSVLVEDPRTTRGLVRYLGSGAVTGLGKEFAKRVVDTLVWIPWPSSRRRRSDCSRSPASARSGWSAFATTGRPTRRTERSTPRSTATASVERSLAASLRSTATRPRPSSTISPPPRQRHRRRWLQDRGWHRARCRHRPRPPRRADAAALHLLQEGKGKATAFSLSESWWRVPVHWRSGRPTWRPPSSD